MMSGTKYIRFADPEVERICIENFSSDGIGVTRDDAATVTSIQELFMENTQITSFDEFKYFTGLTNPQDRPTYMTFRGASSLRTIVIPEGAQIDAYFLYNCPNLALVEFPYPVAFSYGDCVINKLAPGGKIVFRSTTTPSGTIMNTLFWGLQGATIYVPYSSDHSVLQAYLDDFFSLITNVQQYNTIVELNPDGSIPL